MVKSFLSGMFHQFIAGRLRAEMPAADENLINRIVQETMTSERPRRSQRRPFRNPFGLGELVLDWRLEVPHVGAL